MNKRRYLLELQFLGKNFCGSQSQLSKHRTVQFETERALSVLFRQRVTLVLASRVDAGVNAICMPGHFDLELSFLSTSIFTLLEKKSKESFLKLCLRLNGILRSFRELTRTNDISVLSLQESTRDFHATRDALSREYQYRISLSKIELPIWNNQVTYLPKLESLDLFFLNSLSEKLLKIQDFSSFSLESSSQGKRKTFCKVKKALWEFNSEKELYLFEIESDRFLYRMVRLIVGVLIAIKEKKISQAYFEKALKNKLSKEEQHLFKRHIAPAQGLFLKKINYSAPGKLQ